MNMELSLRYQIGVVKFLCIQVHLFISIGNITISPTRGNQLGGTAVTVELSPSPCINSTFKAFCTFDNVKVDGVIEDNQHAVCPMPKLSRLGTVPFVFQLYEGTQLIFEDNKHTFYSGRVGCTLALLPGFLHGVDQCRLGTTLGVCVYKSKNSMFHFPFSIVPGMVSVLVCQHTEHPHD